MTSNAAKKWHKSIEKKADVFSPDMGTARARLQHAGRPWGFIPVILEGGPD